MSSPRRERKGRRGHVQHRKKAMCIYKFRGRASLTVQPQPVSVLPPNGGLAARLMVPLPPEHPAGGPRKGKGKARPKEFTDLRVMSPPLLRE